MKKINLLLLCTILLSAFVWTSCEKSNKDLINDYRKICNEVVECTQKGDLIKLSKLADKGMKLEKELEKRNLSDEEKAELESIQLEMAAASSKAAMEGVDKALDGLDGMMNGSVEKSLEKATGEIEGALNDIENISNEIVGEDN